MSGQLKSKAKLSWLIWMIVGLAATIGLFSLLPDRVSARFHPVETKTHIEIAGRHYGTFDVSNLSDLISNASSSQDSYTRISLRRDFVTDPSLYQWAKKSSESLIKQTDISLVIKTEDGREISRYLLKFCKPLSWSVESSGPALGGFYENVDLAVQEIAVY